MNLDDLADMHPDDDLLKADGFDDCAIGIVERCGQQPYLVYDTNKIIQKLVDEGLSHEEAREHFDFNILGAWVGEATPGYIDCSWLDSDPTKKIDSDPTKILEQDQEDPESHY